MKPEDKTHVHFKSFPRKLNKRLKQLAVREETTIQELVIEACQELLRERIERRKKP